MILVIDNYDSFTYNLYQAVGGLGADVVVARNDEISFVEIADLSPDCVIISPGPGRPEAPEYFGVCTEVILDLNPRTPILGVCLGHQGIIHAFGGQIVSAPRVVHGKCSTIFHYGDPIFAAVEKQFEAITEFHMERPEKLNQLMVDIQSIKDKHPKSS